MPIKRRAQPMIGKTVRLSPDEVKVIARRAKAADLTFHGYMRLRLLAEDAEPLPAVHTSTTVAHEAA